MHSYYTLDDFSSASLSIFDNVHQSLSTQSKFFLDPLTLQVGRRQESTTKISTFGYQWMGPSRQPSFYSNLTVRSIVGGIGDGNKELSVASVLLQ